MTRGVVLVDALLRRQSSTVTSATLNPKRNAVMGLDLNTVMQVAELAAAFETGGASLALQEAESQAVQQVATQAFQGALSQMGSSNQSQLMDSFAAGYGAATGLSSNGGSAQSQAVLDAAYRGGGLQQSSQNLQSQMATRATSSAARRATAPRAGPSSSRAPWPSSRPTPRPSACSRTPLPPPSSRSARGCRRWQANSNRTSVDSPYRSAGRELRAAGTVCGMELRARER
jgi:hypothetical protein